MQKPNKKKPEMLNKGHFIEALDRCECVNNIIDGMLLCHPVIMQNPVWMKEVQKAQASIGKVYQEIGQIN